MKLTANMKTTLLAIHKDSHKTRLMENYNLSGFQALERRGLVSKLRKSVAIYHAVLTEAGYDEVSELEAMGKADRTE